MVSRFTLNQKIVFSFFVLLFGVMVTLFVAVRALFGGSVVAMMRDDLEANIASLERSRQVEERAAIQQAQLVADAPKLKAAIQTSDPATVQNTLQSLLGGLSAAFLMVLDPQGKVLTRAGDAPLQLPHDLADVGRGRAEVQSWDAGTSVFRVVAVPVVSGDTVVGILLIGSRLDVTYLREMGALTRTDVVLLRDSEIVASTLDPASVKPLNDALHHRNGQNWQVELHGIPYLVHETPLWGEPALHLAFLRSLAPYLVVESRMQWLFGIAGAITGLLAVLVSLTLSRNITGPLRRLIEAITLRPGGNARPPRVRLDASDRDVAALETSFNALSTDLERSLLAWENSFDAITEGLFVLDMRQSVTRMNPSAEALVASLGKDAVSVVHYLRFRIEGPCEDCPHEPLASPVREVSWPGSERIFLVSQAPLRGADDAAGGLVVAVQDVTDLQQMRAQVTQKEKLAVLGQTIAGVTHELNNPLTSILGHAELLAERLDDPTMRADVDRLVFDAQRAVQIVRNMLTFARQRKPEVQVVDIGGLVRDTAALRQRACERHGIALEIHIEPDFPAVRADGWQLQQVLINLIVNAEQALVEARVPHPAIRLRGRTRGNAVFVHVEDNGSGFPDAVLAKLFDPFFTTKSSGHGTGLGLSICRNIIAQHEGLLLAGNGLEGGATFVIRLNATRDAPPRPLEVPRENATGPSARILLVDDEASVTSVLTRVLTRMGHQVEVVSRARDALVRLETETFDLIVSDLHMPGMNGEELYEEVKRRWPDLPRRMVFTTGDVLSDDTRDFLEQLENPYLLKPFKVEEIRRRIGGLLTVLMELPN